MTRIYPKSEKNSKGNDVKSAVASNLDPVIEKMKKGLDKTIEKIKPDYKDGKINLVSEQGKNLTLKAEKIFGSYSWEIYIKEGKTSKRRFKEDFSGNIPKQSCDPILIGVYDFALAADKQRKNKKDITVEAFGEKIEIYKMSEEEMEEISFAEKTYQDSAWWAGKSVKASFVDALGSATEQESIAYLLNSISAERGFVGWEISKERAKENNRDFLGKSSSVDVQYTLTIIDNYNIDTWQDKNTGKWHASFSGKIRYAQFSPSTKSSRTITMK